MAKSDEKPNKMPDEILTMSRCRRALEKHDFAARVRIADWLRAIAGEGGSVSIEATKPFDPRQQDMFG